MPMRIRIKQINRVGCDVPQFVRDALIGLEVNAWHLPTPVTIYDAYIGDGLTRKSGYYVNYNDVIEALERVGKIRAAEWFKRLLPCECQLTMALSDEEAEFRGYC